MEDDFESLSLRLKKVLTIIVIITSCFAIFGLISNTISIFVFIRKKCWESTIGFYNVIMSINYNIIIVLNAFIFFPQVLGNDMLLWSDFNCVFFFYGSRVATALASWLIVMASVDMLLRVTTRNRIHFFTKKKNLLVIIGIILMIVIISNFPNIYVRVQTTVSFNITTNQTKISKICAPISVEMDILIDLIRIFVRAIIPFVLIIVINSFLIYKLIKSKLKFNTNNLKKEYSFAMSIASLSIFFILSLLPFVVTVIILKILKHLNITTTKLYIIVNFCYSVSIILCTSYICSFQIVTNLKFNNLFRQEFLNMFKEIKARIARIFQD